ncbi:hypothetical protein F5Y16DRAFT_375201 [Xylariaceae sp. FL0255]|nr:hypothetical protein F5Y16DRAFT_375201 [Xylariaceae sp. FL0255]
MSAPLLPFQQHAASPAKSTAARSSFLKWFLLLLLIWALATWIRVFGLPGNDQPSIQGGSHDNANHGSVIPDYSSPGVKAQVVKEGARPVVSSTSSSETAENTTTMTMTAELVSLSSSGGHVHKYTDRVAVIVEDRPLPNLVPVILHFHAVLGPRWPIILYTTPETSTKLHEFAAFAHDVTSRDIEIRSLPAETKFNDHTSVSTFLTSPFLWTDLAPYEKVLLFQADSILCSAAPAHADDFLEYDLIGAPIDARFGTGFNGGLSLRNRALVLAVIERWNFTADSTAPGAARESMYEDQWFYKRLKEIADDRFAANEMGLTVNLPDFETAARFAVETVYAERPLGYHQPARWQQENMGEIMAYCPEVSMVAGSSFFG